MFIRRLGQPKNGHCEGGHYCPQVLEMTNGDFAVGGPLITDKAVKALPPGPGIGAGEGMVQVPRQVMLAAMADFFASAAA